MQKKANLFIVGAMKAGTTSFVDMLSKHPDIFFSPIKEPNYFVGKLPKKIYSPSKFFSLEDYFKTEFPKPLHIANVANLDDYEKIFSVGNNEKYYAEASTVYLHAKESPKLIHDYNPNSKIIILTREPLKRAYSHYSMNVELGRDVRSFKQALEDEIDDFNNNSLDNFSYIKMSCYEPFISSYQKQFGTENVLVTSLTNSRDSKEDYFNTLFEFLAIDYFDLELEARNKSKTISNPKLVKFLYESGLKDLGSKFLPKSLREKIFDSLSKEKQPLDLPEELTKQFYAIINYNK